MSSSFVMGGLKLRDEQHFTWKIQNFTTMLVCPQAIDAQGFEFRVGESDPKLSTCWRIFLRSDQPGDSIGIYYRRADTCFESTMEVYTECAFVVKNNNNEEVLSDIGQGAFGPLNRMTGEVAVEPWILPTNIKQLLDDDGCVTIHCTFKLFTNHETRSVLGTVQASLEQFHEKSKAEARSLFSMLLETTNSSCEMVKILTMDKVEIEASKCILSVRSPVFEAMFRSNMKEKTEGVIELKDFTANAARVLLHYIYTGELLPTWSNLDILPQLVNAAEKYQFPDLLDFLDCILPSLCDDVHTAKLLLQIAVQFRLKKAEVRIVEFLKEKLENIKTGEEFLKALQNNIIADISSD